MSGNVGGEWHHSFALPPASFLECALVNICLACFEALGDAEHHNSAGYDAYKHYTTVGLSNQASMHE